MAVVSIPFATVPWVSRFSILLTVSAAASFGTAVLIYRKQHAQRVMATVISVVIGMLIGWLLAFLLVPRIAGHYRWITEIDLAFAVIGSVTALAIRATKESR